MLKNTEGQEVDAFEQEMESRIAAASAYNTKYSSDEYTEGREAAYRQALAIYQRCREDTTP